MQSMTMKKIYAWLVHFYTALGAVFCLFAIISAIDAYFSYAQGDLLGYHEYMSMSFFYMAVILIIDGTDGTLARRVDIKRLAPFDGALLDNIIDFSTYAIVPAIWVYVTPNDVIPGHWKIFCIILIMLSSCYQFCQAEAKTKDDFFKGFPSYWNIALFYMIYFSYWGHLNVLIITILAILSFVPIKYPYLSKVNAFTNNRFWQIVIVAMTVIWGAGIIFAAYQWPIYNAVCGVIMIAFAVIYLAMAFYRTFIPLKTSA